MDSIANASTEGRRFTWDRIQRAYQDYRPDVIGLLDAADPAERLTVKSLADFGPEDLTDPPYPLAECLCGNLINPNYLNEQEATCRHCQGLLLNLWDQKMDPDHPRYDADTRRV